MRPQEGFPPPCHRFVSVRRHAKKETRRYTTHITTTKAKVTTVKELNNKIEKKKKGEKTAISVPADS